MTVNSILPYARNVMISSCRCPRTISIFVAQAVKPLSVFLQRFTFPSQTLIKSRSVIVSLLERVKIVLNRLLKN
jgi:hypothetical protein